MNINDIIGKSWLLSLDNSEGYVLSFKLVSPETEQEKTNILIENNLSNIASSENSENEPNQTTNLVSTRKSKFAHSLKLELSAEFTRYFLENDKNFQFFVEEINRNQQAIDILQIRYEELGTTPSNRIKGLINKFENKDVLELLKEIFETCKNLF